MSGHEALPLIQNGADHVKSLEAAQVEKFGLKVFRRPLDEQLLNDGEGKFSC